MKAIFGGDWLILRTRKANKWSIQPIGAYSDRFFRSDKIGNPDTLWRDFLCQDYLAEGGGVDVRRALAERAQEAELSLWELADRSGIRKTERLCRYLTECAVGTYPLPRLRIRSFSRVRPTEKWIRFEILKALSLAKRVQVGWTKEYPEGIPDDDIGRNFQFVESAKARIQFQIEELSRHTAEEERLRRARSKGGKSTGEANHNKALIRRERILTRYQALIAEGANPRSMVSRIAKAEGITPRRVRQILSEEK